VKWGLIFLETILPGKTRSELFRAQLDLAKSVKLPVVIHDRDAHAETLSMLEEEKQGLNGGVIHCFSGDAEMAFKCIDMGFYISIPGRLPLKIAKIQHEAVKRSQLKNLLSNRLSLSCPCAIPGKRNEPLYVTHVAEAISRIKNMPVEEVARITTANSKKLFSTCLINRLVCQDYFAYHFVLFQLLTE